MKDSVNLIDIYKRYLEVTSDMIVILERHYEKLENETNGLKRKREEFIKHAQMTIQEFHEDLHHLFKLSYELKDVEKSEKGK